MSKIESKEEILTIDKITEVQNKYHLSDRQYGGWLALVQGFNLLEENAEKLNAEVPKFEPSRFICDFIADKGGDYAYDVKCLKSEETRRQKQFSIYKHYGKSAN